MSSVVNNCEEPQAPTNGFDVTVLGWSVHHAEEKMQEEQRVWLNEIGFAPASKGGGVNFVGSQARTGTDNFSFSARTLATLLLSIRCSSAGCVYPE